MGIRGYGWPNCSCIMSIIFASFVFKNNAPSSTSAVEAAINLNIFHKHWIVPMDLIGFLSIGIDLRKNTPTQLRSVGAV